MLIRARNLYRGTGSTIRYKRLTAKGQTLEEDKKFHLDAGRSVAVSVVGAGMSAYLSKAICVEEDRTAVPFAESSFRLVEERIAEICSAEVRLPQVRVAQVCLSQVRLTEVRRVEIRPAEDRAV